MSTADPSIWGLALPVVGVVVVVWGLTGLVRTRSQAYGRYRVGWGARVSQVDPGGPAAEGGRAKVP